MYFFPPHFRFVPLAIRADALEEFKLEERRDVSSVGFFPKLKMGIP